MSLGEVLSATSAYLAVAMLIQGAELFLISRGPSFREIWSDRNLRRDLKRGLPLPEALTGVLFSLEVFPWIAFAQVAAALGLLALGFPALFVPLLFLTHLLICLRFRGTFNGGSDMMTFILLTGLLISSWASNETLRQLGMIYIAIHLFYSYLKAGLVKLAQADWRRGAALPAFLDRSLYPPTRRLSAWLQGHLVVSWLLCWLVIFFEISILTLPFIPAARPLYFAAAILFHLINYLAFGLNRFFWAWLAAWPALFYAMSLLGSGPG